MSGMLKVWKLAALKAERRLSKAEARQGRNDIGKNDRALRLLRKGAISRAGKALESKGMGDLSDPEVLKELKEKFSRRIIDISQDTYAYQQEVELQLKMDKMLCKLD